MAVNFWFHHLPWFNSSDCEGVDPYQNSSVPLSSVKKPDPDSEIRFYSTGHHSINTSISKLDLNVLFLLIYSQRMSLVLD